MEARSNSWHQAQTRSFGWAEASDNHPHTDLCWRFPPPRSKKRCLRSCLISTSLHLLSLVHYILSSNLLLGNPDLLRELCPGSSKWPYLFTSPFTVNDNHVFWLQRMEGKVLLCLALFSSNGILKTKQIIWGKIKLKSETGAWIWRWCHLAFGACNTRKRLTHRICYRGPVLAARHDDQQARCLLQKTQQPIKGHSRKRIPIYTYIYDHCESVCVCVMSYGNIRGRCWVYTLCNCMCDSWLIAYLYGIHKSMYDMKYNYVSWTSRSKKNAEP